MKKIGVLLVAVLSIGLCVSIVSALNYDSYSFKKVGDYDVGTGRKLPYKYPYVMWENDTPDSDAHLAITLNKKNFFGQYLNVTRQQKWIKNVDKYNFKFSKQSTGTYRCNAIFNDSNDNKPIAGRYYLTSVEG